MLFPHSLSRCAGCHPAFPPRLPPPPECPWRHRGALISVYAVALSDSRSGNCLLLSLGRRERWARLLGRLRSGLQRTLCASPFPELSVPANATSSAPLTSIGKTVRGLGVCWAADGKGFLQPICTLFIFNFRPPPHTFICKNFCRSYIFYTKV